MAFSPEDDTLSSAGDDGTVRLWDVAARRELTALSGHSADVPALALSPDGQLLAAVGEDTTLRLWKLNPTSWQRRLYDLAGRNLTRQQWDEFLPVRATAARQPAHAADLVAVEQRRLDAYDHLLGILDDPDTHDAAHPQEH